MPGGGKYGAGLLSVGAPRLAAVFPSKLVDAPSRGPLLVVGQGFMGGGNESI